MTKLDRLHHVAVYFIGHFIHCCHQIPEKKQSKGGKDLFDLWFEEIQSTVCGRGASIIFYIITDHGARRRQ